jgi:hypothetical protein
MRRREVEDRQRWRARKTFQTAARTVAKKKAAKTLK